MPVEELWNVEGVMEFRKKDLFIWLGEFKLSFQCFAEELFYP